MILRGKIKLNSGVTGVLIEFDDQIQRKTEHTFIFNFNFIKNKTFCAN